MKFDIAELLISCPRARRFPLTGCTVWFLKVSLHLPSYTFACGSTAGVAHLWTLPGAPASDASADAAPGAAEGGEGEHEVVAVAKGKNGAQRRAAWQRRAGGGDGRRQDCLCCAGLPPSRSGRQAVGQAVGVACCGVTARGGSEVGGSGPSDSVESCV